MLLLHARGAQLRHLPQLLLLLLLHVQLLLRLQLLPLHLPLRLQLLLASPLQGLLLQPQLLILQCQRVRMICQLTRVVELLWGRRSSRSSSSSSGRLQRQCLRRQRVWQDEQQDTGACARRSACLRSTFP